MMAGPDSDSWRFGPLYWDRQGNPVADARTWARLYDNNPEYRRVDSTVIGYVPGNDGGVCVSTVWVGLDMELGRLSGDRPLIFETMVFVSGPDPHPELANWDGVCCRYATEAQAVVGHARMCIEIRVLLEHIRMADEVLTEAIERSNDRKDSK